MSPGAKKLVSSTVTSTPMTETRREAVETAEIAGKGRDGKESKNEYSNLARVPCIRYPITIQKKFVPVSALLDSGSEVNTIHPTYTQELGLSMKTTDVGAQKIVSTMLDIFKMVIAVFSVMDKANRVRFFEETFLVANISPKVVFGIPFLTMKGAHIDFLGRKLW